MLEGAFFVGIVIGVDIEYREIDSVDKSIRSMGGVETRGGQQC